MWLQVLVRYSELRFPALVSRLSGKMTETQFLRVRLNFPYLLLRVLALHSFEVNVK